MTQPVTQAKATELLDQYGGGRFPVPVIDIANHLGIQVYAEANYPEGKSGHIEVHDDGSYAVIVNESQADVRKRFTIAHEIAHFIFDINYLNKHKVVDRDGNVLDGTYRERERRANDFAARLLMPEDNFLEQWIAKSGSVESVAEYFGVSKESAKIRAVNLGLATA